MIPFYIYITGMWSWDNIQIEKRKYKGEKHLSMNCKYLKLITWHIFNIQIVSNGSPISTNGY